MTYWESVEIPLIVSTAVFRWSVLRLVTKIFAIKSRSHLKTVDILGLEFMRDRRTLNILRQFISAIYPLPHRIVWSR